MEDYFENFKETKLKLLKNKDMREHIKNVVEKALNCGNPKYGYIKYIYMDSHAKVSFVQNVEGCILLIGQKNSHKIC